MQTEIENKSLISEPTKRGPKIKDGSIRTANSGVSIQKLRPILKTSKLEMELEQEPTNQIEELVKDYSKKKKSANQLETMKGNLISTLESKLYKQVYEVSDASSKCSKLTVDGRVLVTGSEDGTVKVFIKQSFGNSSRERFTLQGSLLQEQTNNRTINRRDRKKFVSVTISEQKNYIFGGATDGSITVWRRSGNSGSWSVLETLKAHDKDVKSLATTADGKTLISASFDGSIKIWRRNEFIVSNIVTERYVTTQTLKEHAERVYSVDVTHDGSLFFSGAEDNYVMVWNRVGLAKEGRYNLSQTLLGHTEPVRAVASTPDGSLFVSASNDLCIRIWIRNIESGSAVFRHLQTLKGHSWHVNSVAISANGRMIVSGSGDNSARIWMTRTGSESLFYTHNQTLQGPSKIVCSVEISGDGESIISNSVNGNLRVWEKNQFNLGNRPSYHGVIDKHSMDILDLAADEVDGPGSRLFSVSADNSVKLFKRLEGCDYTERKTIKVKNGHTEQVTAVCVTADGSRMFTASEDKMIKVFNQQEDEGYQEGQNLSGHLEGILALAASADGSTLFSAGKDDIIVVWVKKEDGYYTLHEKLAGHTNTIWKLACTPDGKTVVSVSSDFTIRVWKRTKFDKERLQREEEEKQKQKEEEGGEEVGTFEKQKEEKVKTFTYKEHQVLKGHSKTIYSVDISRNGRTIISGSRDNSIKVWLMKLEDGKYQ